MTSTRGPDEGDTPLEAPEADVAEQRTPVDPNELDDVDGSDDPIPAVRTADVDADEGDLLEQATPVPLEDDDE
jgi:hypothetical protein